MKYPEDYINKIICGDCLEVMKGIPDKAVDLVPTDPWHIASNTNIEVTAVELNPEIQAISVIITKDKLW